MAASTPSYRIAAAFAAGAAVGTLGGLIGLGGAEFRLPLLIGLFGFVALHAVILNKAMSLIVVASALVFRSGTVPLMSVLSHWPTIVNLLAGSLAGAWVGAAWATRLSHRRLYQVIAVLLVVIAAALLFGHGQRVAEPLLVGAARLIAGVAAGFFIGVAASVMGVAGGELLIPTLVLLFGADLKLAGSLSVAISLPTMLIGFVRYSQDRAFRVLANYKPLVAAMAAGSLLGTALGGQLLGVVPDTVLLPVLAAILLVSSWRVWRHR